MKWGGVFCKKKWKMFFFVKKVDLSSTQGTLCTLSVFFILHFTYFFGRGGSCICTQRTPPAYGPGECVVGQLSDQNSYCNEHRYYILICGTVFHHCRGNWLDTIYSMMWYCISTPSHRFVSALATIHQSQLIHLH